MQLFLFIKTRIIPKMSLSLGLVNICSLDKMAIGWPIEETQCRLNGRVGKTRSKKTIGAGPCAGRILTAFLAPVKID